MRFIGYTVSTLLFLNCFSCLSPLGAGGFGSTARPPVGEQAGPEDSGTLKALWNDAVIHETQKQLDTIIPRLEAFVGQSVEKAKNPANPTPETPEERKAALISLLTPHFDPEAWLQSFWEEGEATADATGKNLQVTPKNWLAGASLPAATAYLNASPLNGADAGIFGNILTHLIAFGGPAHISVSHFDELADGTTANPLLGTSAPYATFQAGLQTLVGPPSSSTPRNFNAALQRTQGLVGVSGATSINQALETTLKELNSGLTTTPLTTLARTLAALLPGGVSDLNQAIEALDPPSPTILLAVKVVHSWVWDGGQPWDRPITDVLAKITGLIWIDAPNLQAAVDVVFKKLIPQQKDRDAGAADEPDMVTLLDRAIQNLSPRETNLSDAIAGLQKQIGAAPVLGRAPVDCLTQLNDAITALSGTGPTRDPNLPEALEDMREVLGGDPTQDLYANVKSAVGTLESTALTLDTAITDLKGAVGGSGADVYTNLGAAQTAIGGSGNLNTQLNTLKNLVGTVSGTGSTDLLAQVQAMLVGFNGKYPGENFQTLAEACAYALTQ